MRWLSAILLIISSIAYADPTWLYIDPGYGCRFVNVHPHTTWDDLPDTVVGIVKEDHRYVLKYVYERNTPEGHSLNKGHDPQWHERVIVMECQ